MLESMLLGFYYINPQSLRNVKLETSDLILCPYYNIQRSIKCHSLDAAPTTTTLLSMATVTVMALAIAPDIPTTTKVMVVDFSVVKTLPGLRQDTVKFTIT